MPKKSGGRSSRNKGSRVEREMVHLHLDAGVPCERVPLSGAVGGSWSGDLKILGGQLRAEVKARRGGSGFSTMEGWLKGNDLLILKRDRSEPFVAMNWDTYIQLLHCFQRQLEQARENCSQ